MESYDLPTLTSRILSAASKSLRVGEKFLELFVYYSYAMLPRLCLIWDGLRYLGPQSELYNKDHSTFG